MIASVRFLIDADLPRSTKALLEKFGHEAIDVRDIGLRSVKDQVIARYAQDHQACLLTGDFGFADIRNYPPETYYGIVVLGLPRDARGGGRLPMNQEERTFATSAPILIFRPSDLPRAANGSKFI